MAPRPPLQEDRREGQDDGGEAGWQGGHGGVSRRGWASLTVPPAAPPSSPRRPLSRPPNPPPNGQSRAKPTSPDLGACGGERMAAHAGPASGGTPSRGIAGPGTASSAVTGHVA